MTREVMKILTLSSLYPSSVRKRHGVFVETRLRHLVASGRVQARVVSPVPWFPFRGEIFGEFGRQARTPRREIRHGIEVHYPRYPMIPKIGMSVQPNAMVLGVRRTLEAVRASGFDFDLIDANYFYPDGVAAAGLARALGKAFTVTARGSDINVIAKIAGPRRAILRAADEASSLIAVSSRLRDSMIDLGMDGRKITVIRNGVDLEQFRPEPQDEARSALGLNCERLVASVGNLVTGKGHDLAIRAVAGLQGVALVVVGRGPARGSLETLVRELGMQERVFFRDEMPQDHLRFVYSAADVLALFSAREGWPNVVLEALACGIPVVACNVGGVREMLTNEISGIVVEGRSDAELRSALSRAFLLAGYRDERRRHAAMFGWQEVVEQQLAVFERVLASRNAH